MPLRSRNRPLQPKEGFEQGCSGYLFRGGGKGWRLLGSYPIGRLSRRLHASSPLFYYYVLGHLSDRFPCRRFCLHGGDSLFPFYPWASLGEWCGGYYQVRKLSCGGYKMRGFRVIWASILRDGQMSWSHYFVGNKKVAYRGFMVERELSFGSITGLFGTVHTGLRSLILFAPRQSCAPWFYLLLGKVYSWRRPGALELAGTGFGYLGADVAGIQWVYFQLLKHTHLVIY